MKKIYAVGNTHFDPVWLWQWNEAMTSIHATFRSALDRMNEDPDFCYSFATPPVFEWIRQTDPEMLEEIRARVREGRWETPEGWWVQPDCFSATGESYARQSLYGQKYLLECFGTYSDTVFNVDSFGHCSQTPQILSESGMKYYCLCRPEEKHYPIESPYFSWVGKDGSTVRAFRVGQYSEVYNKDLRAAVAEATRRMEHAECDEMMLLGVTDHGGAPTKRAIADVHALQGEGVGISFSTVRSFFEAQGTPRVSVHGEMLTGDYGPYVNHHGIKHLNRVAEYEALNAERAALIGARLLGRAYPKERLDSVWRDILFNQFHDILGGASTKEAYVDAYRQLGRAITDAGEIKHLALAALTHKLRTVGVNPDNPWSLTVWNLNASPFDGFVEAELQWLHEFPAYKGGIRLEDETGKRYPCQLLLEGSVIDGFRSRILFRTAIDGIGYKTFKVIKTEEADRISDYLPRHRISTDAFEVEFDGESGWIKSLCDKRRGRTHAAPIRPRIFEDHGDTWCFNVSGYGKPIDEWHLESIETVESGIHRTTVKTVHTHRASTLTLYYTFYQDTDYFDLSFRVSFNEKHAVLKMAVDLGCEELLVSSPFATETRGDNERDCPMGEWLASHDSRGGVAVIADSSFAYNKQGTRVCISLLRSCIYGDLRLCDLDPHADYPYMEQGISEGRVRFYAFDGAPDGRVTALSAAFNNPPEVVCDTNHEGILPPANVLVRVDGGVSVSALKAAYDGEGEILRLYEPFGNEAHATVDYFGTHVDLSLSPYRIQTLRIQNGVAEEVTILEDRL